jgi:UDP-2,3-diacylglucosamine pyrophosphatase LpxH
MTTPRTLVLGDLHLTRFSTAEVTRDLCAFLARHAGERVIVAGDFFDLVTDDPRRERRETVKAVLDKTPALRAALGTFLDRGGSLTLLGGNHDAELGRSDVRDALVEALAPSAEGRARLVASSWFLRHGGVHLEHGHFYDPDNAPAHPLVIGEPSLGVHFSAEFMHPTQAHRYLSNNDTTPLKLLLSAFTWYGKRGPYVVYRYFHAAFLALARSGPFYRARHERRHGDGYEARYAEDAGVPRELVDQLLALGPTPTLESLSATFARLYMDRVTATLLATSGLASMALGARSSGAALTILGALLMTASWVHQHDRYVGSVVERLDLAARRITETTDAKLVIFGHTHREALGDGYANTGSFAYPRGAPGRPYLEIVDGAGGPRAVRRYLEPEAASLAGVA